MTARFIENGFSNKQAIVLSDAIRESREELVTKDHFDVELDRVHVELDKFHVEIEQVRVEIREFKLEIGVKFNTFRDEISAKFSTFRDEVSEKLGQTKRRNTQVTKVLHPVVDRIRERDCGHFSIDFGSCYEVLKYLRPM